MIHPVRVAHRGASGVAPENTIAAFERAIHMGVDAIEVDVHGTGDGRVVVIHDPTLDRTTDRHGLVRASTLDEIREADAGSWFDDGFLGERVPLLEEAIERCRHRALLLIEIKADFLAEKVLQIVYEMDALSHVVIQSFNPETLRRVKLIDATVPTALLIGKLPAAPSRVRARKMVKQVLEVGANALAIWHATLTPPFFEEMRKRAVTVWAWTVDEELVMRDMVQMGVQGIITNHPERLNRVLENLEGEGLIQTPLGRRQRLKPTRWGRRRRLRKLRKSPLVNEEPQIRTRKRRKKG